MNDLTNAEFIQLARERCELAIASTNAGKYLGEALRRLEEAEDCCLPWISHHALARSAFDIAPCRVCGEPVVCIPDGLPFCEECADDE